MRISSFFTTGIILSGAFIGSFPSANADIYCNSYGRCTGTTSSGQSVNTYTNQYGRTTGTIGGSSVNTYTNQYGRTTGTIGGSSINCYSNSYGRTSC